MDVLVLIDELDDALNDAKSGLLSPHVRLDRRQMFSILDRMRATIPEELKQARWITKEAHEMRAEARRESERILEEARQERDRLVGAEEVARLAERRAERIVQGARTRERQVRFGADDYADGILQGLQVGLERFSSAVQRGQDRPPGSQ
jgi:cell division septum initiation protein DivIVA